MLGAELHFGTVLEKSSFIKVACLSLRDFGCSSQHTNQQVPDVALHLILSFVNNMETIFSFRQCCKQFYSVHSDDAIWKRFLIQKRGLQLQQVEELKNDFKLIYYMLKYFDLKDSKKQRREKNDVCSSGSSNEATELWQFKDADFYYDIGIKPIESFLDRILAHIDGYNIECICYRGDLPTVLITQKNPKKRNTKNDSLHLSIKDKVKQAFEAAGLPFFWALYFSYQF